MAQPKKIWLKDGKLQTYGPTWKEYSGSKPQPEADNVFRNVTMDVTEFYWSGGMGEPATIVYNVSADFEGITYNSADATPEGGQDNIQSLVASATSLDFGMTGFVWFWDEEHEEITEIPADLKAYLEQIITYYLEYGNIDQYMVIDDGVPTYVTRWGKQNPEDEEEVPMAGIYMGYTTDENNTPIGVQKTSYSVVQDVSSEHVGFSIPNNQKLMNMMAMPGTYLSPLFVSALLGIQTPYESLGFSWNAFQPTFVYTGQTNTIESDIPNGLTLADYENVTVTSSDSTIATAEIDVDDENEIVSLVISGVAIGSCYIEVSLTKGGKTYKNRIGVRVENEPS